ncbi:MAG: anti-sigma factor antagonist [Caldithrix sp.]|nr:anti-sigma factor antagonist [Caldithrix sp.]
MKIKETIHQKVAVLTLKGKLMGPPGTMELYEAVNNLLSDGVFRFVLDLKRVTWINSLGIGTIMKCLSTVKKADGQIHLANISEKVNSVFAMSQLTKVFTIHEQVENAVDVLNKS